MKQQNLTLMLFCILVFGSCKKDEFNTKETFSFLFYPRECTQIITESMQNKQSFRTINGNTFEINIVEAMEGGSVEAKNYVLWLMTGADDLKLMKKDFPNVKNRNYEFLYQDPLKERYNQLAPSIPSLEKQLEDDYRNSISTRAASGKDGMSYAFINPWDYRVTGVKDFKIIALSPLFGQPAETSLNRFFSIHSFEPKQVISYRTKKLLWGYSDKSNLENLQQWLSMEPMAPPAIMFRFNTVPQEVPAEVKFVSILETTDGKILKDTTFVKLR